MASSHHNKQKYHALALFLLVFVFFLSLLSIAYGAQIIAVAPFNNTVLSPFQTHVIVNLTTNETANCSYAITPDMSNRQSFTQTNAVTHQITFAITAGTSYDYYYQCESPQDANQTLHHHFSVDPALTLSNTATETSGTTANLTFTTNRNANYTLAYGTSQENDWHTYPFILQKNENAQTVTFPLTGLSEKTTYFYTVVANDTWGSEKTLNSSFTTKDTTAPKILSLSNTSTESTLTVFWNTDEPANCTLAYGTTTALGSSVTFSLSTSFSKTLAGYDPETTVYWKVLCDDEENNHNETSIKSGKTKADTTPPTITVESPSGTVADDDVKVELTTNEPATCRYASSEESYEAMNVITSSLATSHNITLYDLPNGKYTYWISCADAKQNIATTSFRFTVNQTIVNETYYGDNIGNPHPYQPLQPKQEEPRFVILTYNFTNLSKAQNQRINYEGFILKEFTLYPQQFYNLATVTVRRLYDFTEVNDVQQIIYQAYHITTDPEMPYQIGFSVSRIWLKQKDALPDHIRVFVYQDYRWKALKPTIAYQNSRGLYYLLSGLKNGYIIIGLDKEAVLQYQLEQKLLQQQEPKANPQQKVSPTTTSTTTLKKTQPIGYQEPLQQEALLASPEELSSQHSLSILALGVFLVALVGMGISGVLLLKKKNGNKTFEHLKEELKEEAEKAKTLLDELVEEIIVGDGITPALKREEKKKEETAAMLFQSEEDAEKLDALLADTHYDAHNSLATSSSQQETSQETLTEEKTLQALDAVREELLAEQDAIAALEEKLQDQETTIKKMQQQSERLAKVSQRLLTTFIAKSLAQGFAPEKIKRVLLHKGYTQEEIEDAFHKAQTNLFTKLKQKKLDLVYEKVLWLTIKHMVRNEKTKKEIIAYLKEHHIPERIIQKLIKRLS